MALRMSRRDQVPFAACDGEGRRTRGLRWRCGARERMDLELHSMTELDNQRMTEYRPVYLWASKGAICNVWGSHRHRLGRSRSEDGESGAAEGTHSGLSHRGVASVNARKEPSARPPEISPTSRSPLPRNRPQAKRRPRCCTTVKLL